MRGDEAASGKVTVGQAFHRPCVADFNRQHRGADTAAAGNVTAGFASTLVRRIVRRGGSWAAPACVGRPQIRWTRWRGCGARRRTVRGGTAT